MGISEASILHIYINFKFSTDVITYEYIKVAFLYYTYHSLNHSPA